jgi:hypothetical protein
MLKLKALELIQLFRQPGGAEFVLFCNEMLRDVCFKYAIPQSDVSTCSRTDAKDGGVDTRICSPARGNEPFGFFGSPSAWQFKASDEVSLTHTKIRAEVNKTHARACIEAGDAYRICVCAHIADDKKQELERALNSEVIKINHSAPPAKILNIDDLVAMANAFPALTFSYHLGLDARCIVFGAWGANATAVTKVFIPNSAFDATRAKILAHVDLAANVPDPVLTLQGEAGVGKTRTVYEALRSSPASALVLYTDNEDHAIEIANQIANNETLTAIIVADDCSLSGQEALDRKLIGCRDRVRCVCIDNSLLRAATPAPMLSVRKLTASELEQILKANFTSIPPDRIRTYAHFSEGFVRLAADMCQYDPQIAQAAAISPIVTKVELYYRDRLRSEQRLKAVEAIALLKRVRRRGDAPTEFDELCNFLQLDKIDTEQTLASIKESPGFIERGALYYRVTPQLIAIIAFSAAWRRWASGREQEFLSRLPNSIQESFLQRVSESADEGVRSTVQDFFRRFADRFTPKDLADAPLVNKLILLMETDPETYLPKMQQVINSATDDELTAEPDWTRGSWGARRQLVWLAERYAQFPEFFAACEQILFILAQHECEPNIGNNATKTWQQLFRIQLSGTAVPFTTRLGLLKRRIDLADASDGPLLAGALDRTLDVFSSRMLGPPVIGGRIPPHDWFPRTHTELQECIEAGLRLIDAATRSAEPLASSARKIFLDNIVTYAGGWAPSPGRV